MAPALLILASAFAVPVAGAADVSSPVFVVNSLDDGNASCAPTPSTSTCTLRDAVSKANGAAETATIVLPAGTIHLSSGSGDGAGDLDIARSVRIVGARRPTGDAAASTIDAGGFDRVVELTTAGTVATIEGVALTNGSAKTGGGALVAADTTLRLIDSSVAGNVAADRGGGIDSAGTLVVSGSTISGNTAAKKGGGVHSAGVAEVVNSTIHANTSSSGGAVLSTGSADLQFVTINGNVTTTRLGGGVQRAGGVTTIGWSIVTGNTSNSGEAKDCSGSPSLAGPNLIGNLQGCNPTGTPPTSGAAGLGPLADNGGPTLTQRLLRDSSAIDAGGQCAVELDVDVDQRGVERPQRSACDLGAFELEAFGFSLDLTAESDEVRAGAAVVPTANLLELAAPPGPEASPLRSIPLRSILVDSIDFEAVPLRSIDVVDAPLRSIPLRSIPLRSIFTAFAPLRSIPLRSIPLRSILLSDIPIDHAGGWEALLAGTPLQSVPLQMLTIGDVLEDAPGAIDAVDLGDVDLSATRLGVVSLVSILLGATPLRSITVDGQAICTLLGPVCDEITDESSLMAAEISGAPLRSIPLRSIYLATLDLADAPLRSIPLRSIALAQLSPEHRDALVDCAALLAASDVACDADGATIGLAFDKSAIRADATLAQLIVAILGEENLEWQDLDLTSGGLGAAALPEDPSVAFTYTATLDVRGGAAADVDLDVTLPPGFVTEPGSVTLGGAPIPDPAFDPGTLTMTFDLQDLAPGPHRLTFVAKAGVVLGAHTATAAATATAPGEQPITDAAENTTTVVVEETFEKPDPNVDWRPLVPNALHLAHISAPGDVDLYRFDVTDQEARRGAHLSILLSNLPADFDLALYGPPATRMRGEPVEARDMLPDHLVDIEPADDHLTAEPTADVPQHLPFVPDDDAVIHRVGGRRDTSPESIEVSGLRAGTYWIQVSGANGAWSADPYALRTRKAVDPERPCAAPSLHTAPTSRRSVLPQEMDTLFLVNASRFEAAFDTADHDAAADLTAIHDFATSTEHDFVGGVLYVDTIAAIHAAYGRWDDGNRCDPIFANAVVSAIGAHLDTITATTPTLRNIVVVGNDAQIPMARMADNTVIANERSYGDELPVNDEVSSALRTGHVLTDNVLAARSPIDVNDHEVFVPELAIGRLVETPAEILEVIASFTAADGLLDPSTALVTGYDFLSDGADAVADALAVPEDSPDRMIDESWDRAALTDALGSKREVASINAHFDHHRLLPALGNSTHDESDLFDSSAVPAVAGNVRGSILFSMGCHSGLNVSDVTIGGARDWAQTFAGAGAHWVANTGYGYGDTETVALSERLMASFAARLVAGESAGEALAAAKRDYMSLRPLVSSYDEKVVHEAVLYGLPMLEVGSAEPAESLRALAASATSAAVPAPAADPLTGLPAAPVSFDFTVAADETTVGADTLTPRTVNGRRYYHVDDGTLMQSRRPIQPLTSKDVTSPGEHATGFLVTALESRDEDAFSPVFFSPTIDLADHEPAAMAADATFPSTMAAVTSTNGPDGRTDRLVVVPGQYRRTDTSGTGVQRLYTGIGGVVYYGDADGAGPPVGMRSTAATFEPGDTAGQPGGRVRFEVELDHAAVRVYVLYKLIDADSPWQGVDLVKGPFGTTWVGQGPALGDVEYIVQAVDAHGRVVKADAKGDNFESLSGDVNELGIVLDPPANDSGWHKTAVTASFPGAPGPVLYSVDGSDYHDLVSGSVTVPSAGPLDGVHSIVAIASGPNDDRYIGQRTILIDATAPTVTVSATPQPDTSGWNRSSVSLSAVAADGTGGSGIDGLTYVVNGSSTTIDGASAIIPVGAQGTTTVQVTATDVAGNSSATVTVTVRVDSVAPLVSCSAPTPAPKTADGWHDANVSVPCTATDATSGMATSASFSLSTSVAPGAFSAAASTGAISACDVAGNCTPVAARTFKVDRENPDVAIAIAGATIVAGSTLTTAFSCSDQASGVASCVGVVDGVTLTPGSPLPTTSFGAKTITVTATDNVGNTTIESASYTVFGYSICPQYNELQPNSIGSTVPIKVQLCDSTGKNLSSSTIEVQAVIVNGDVEVPPNFVGNTNYGNVFRFGQKTYIYNLNTEDLVDADGDHVGPGTHTLFLRVGGIELDGYRVRFTLR